MILSANELRIGNFIKGASRGQIETVTGKMIAQIEEGKVSVNPVELTKEILRKARFDIEEGGYLQLRGEDFWIKEVGISKYQYVKGMSRDGEPFSFLHKLQNLYYGLTGQELPIYL